MPKAIKATNKSFFLGVQFHPETLVDYGNELHLNIFNELVRAAQK